MIEFGIVSQDILSESSGAKKPHSCTNSDQCILSIIPLHVMLNHFDVIATCTLVLLRWYFSDEKPHHYCNSHFQSDFSERISDLEYLRSFSRPDSVQRELATDMDTMYYSLADDTVVSRVLEI